MTTLQPGATGAVSLPATAADVCSEPGAASRRLPTYTAPNRYAAGRLIERIAGPGPVWRGTYGALAATLLRDGGVAAPLCIVYGRRCMRRA